MYDLGVLDAIKELNHLGIVHHTRNHPVQGLSVEQGPDMCSEGKFRCGTLETNEIEWEIVNLGLIFLIISEGDNAVEHGGLFCEDLGSLDEILPFDRVLLDHRCITRVL